MMAMRLVFAGIFELRTDEAYYWTWSQENVLSFLDHPPMIAWFVRFGTAIFGDTAFGVRFAGIVAMAVMQLLLVDIVRRVTQDLRAMVVTALMTEAALYYGLLMAKVAPDVAMIPFAVAMLWSMVRVAETNDGRWWLATGLFGGLAMLAKLTALMFVPGILVFMLVPAWRLRWLTSPYPWLATLIAIIVSSPVLIWNEAHDWASFRFQFVRVTAAHDWSLRTFGEFFGLQFVQVGFVLLPLIVSACAVTAWRGWRRQDPIALLFSSSVLVPFLYFVWTSLSLRVGDTWPMFLWPAAIAGAAINMVELPGEGWSNGTIRIYWRSVQASIAVGMTFVVLSFLYCTVAPWNLFGRNDPVGTEAGYDKVAERALQDMRNTGATWIATTNYRVYAMLRWHLRDRVPVVQVTERARFLDFSDPGSAQITGHPGLLIAGIDDQRELLRAAGATLEPIGSFTTMWRGTPMRYFEIEKITGWTPELNPAPDTPLYRWRNLADAPRPMRLARVARAS
ncbi:glycosyltransferase family 39 protein [Tardiphaga alba]|uniref:Glycosyltransferase family 39 protein n=2 Tax=Tardiphaga alba TaxID=340268 RepID=A0ABX8AEX1_9BRAD|nr:glycosyltransferase family 39 protein [Tardiphaga alba]QUS42316.1 glycosyltransferase family 39 protein [Tardiphaga alba]